MEIFQATRCHADSEISKTEEKINLITKINLIFTFWFTTMARSSSFELNDTLQITKEQGFPGGFDIVEYMKGKLNYEDQVGKIFEFHNKPNLRNFAVPPVRVFLVENKDGKRIYRWRCHILEVNLDYENKTTSWKYKIIKIFSPEEIPLAFDLIDGNKETNYFW